LCTCEEFQKHLDDPEFTCKHIKAVEEHLLRQNHNGGGNGDAAAPVRSVTPTPAAPAESKRTRSNGQAASADKQAQMLLKRSVSPDGRIDSLSVEFTVPVGKTATEDIKAQSAKILALQAEIVQAFLKGKGSGAAQARSNPAPQGEPAQLLAVSSMNTRKGHTLFLNVLVGKQTVKLFGDAGQLGEAVTAAGFPDVAPHLADGMSLNLPCRVVTRQNGKYLNIDRVLPATAERAA
ncbi:MAG: hypothetical protein ACYDH9_26870, partial [Limisphaerales bacterium]